MMADTCEICEAGFGPPAGIAVLCSTFVVELLVHFQAIEDALPRGIDALGCNIGLCFDGEVRSAFA